MCKLGARPEATTAAEVIQVIHTVSGRGQGTMEDTFRYVHQYWSLDGKKLAEHDPRAYEEAKQCDE